MATSTSPSHRQWREIAKEASEEYDPNKALELAQELIRSLDAESRKRMERITPEKASEKGAA